MLRSSSSKRSWSNLYVFFVKSFSWNQFHEIFSWKCNNKKSGIPSDGLDSTIPKSTKKSRILENFQFIDFELSEDSMLVLDELHTNNYKVIKLEDIQERIDKDLPDGYKMKCFGQYILLKFILCFWFFSSRKIWKVQAK